MDERFCPHLDTLTFDMSVISSLVKKQEFPKDWIKAYDVLEDY